MSEASQISLMENSWSVTDCLKVQSGKLLRMRVKMLFWFLY